MSIQDKFEKLDKQLDRDTNRTNKDINKQYKKLLREIKAEMREQMDKYGTYDEFVKYGRLEKLEEKVNDKIKSYTVPIAQKIRSSLRESFKKGFSDTKSALEEESKRKIRGLIKPETITEAIQNPVSGLKLNRRLNARRAETILKINENIVQGLRRGESYSQMSKRLQETLEIEAGKANRIVATEGHRVQEAGKTKSLNYADSQGVQMKKYWLTSKDERVRSSHAHMGDKYSKDNAIPYNEDFVNDRTGGRGPSPGNMGTPEDDINCRCIMVVVVE